MIKVWVLNWPPELIWLQIGLMKKECYKIMLEKKRKKAWHSDHQRVQIAMATWTQKDLLVFLALHMEILIRDKKKRCDNIIYMFGKIEITPLTILANLSFRHSWHVDVVDDKSRWWKGKYCPSHCCGPTSTAGLVFHQCWLWEPVISIVLCWWFSWVSLSRMLKHFHTLLQRVQMCPSNENR